MQIRSSGKVSNKPEVCIYKYEYMLYSIKNVKSQKYRINLAQALAQATRARPAAGTRDLRKELAQALAQAKCAEHVLAQGLAQVTRANKLAPAWILL